MTNDTHDPLAEAVEVLTGALKEDDPIFADDDTLISLAQAATEELRRRYPRYGLDAGDLDDEEMVELRENAANAAERLR